MVTILRRNQGSTGTFNSAIAYYSKLSYLWDLEQLCQSSIACIRWDQISSSASLSCRTLRRSTFPTPPWFSCTWASTGTASCWARCRGSCNQAAEWCPSAGRFPTTSNPVIRLALRGSPFSYTISVNALHESWLQLCTWQQTLPPTHDASYLIHSKLVIPYDLGQQHLLAMYSREIGYNETLLPPISQCGAATLVGYIRKFVT